MKQQVTCVAASHGMQDNPISETSTPIVKRVFTGDVCQFCGDATQGQNILNRYCFIVKFYYKAMGGNIL
jgi:hypothetical protein